MPAGRPSEYNLNKYNGKSVIYALYTDLEGIKYIGHSINVKRRFNHHLNNSYETNLAKKYWIEKHKNEIKIKILSADHHDWEKEEKFWIKKHRDTILNISEGGSNNWSKKPFELMTCEDHLHEINKSFRELNKFLKRKRFTPMSKQEINELCQIKN